MAGFLESERATKEVTSPLAKLSFRTAELTDRVGRAIATAGDRTGTHGAREIETSQTRTFPR